MSEKDVLERMYAAADQMKEQDDNLLKAIAMLAATGHMTIVPGGSMMFGTKPVIMLPDHMYQRMEELFPAKPPAPSPHPDQHRV